MSSRDDRTGKQRYGKRAPLLLLKQTLRNVWAGSIFSAAAKAAYWQTLSLPPLLLGLLGSVGYISDWVRKDVVHAVQHTIVEIAAKAFTPNVMASIIKPTVEQILTKAQGEVASVGFLISLWAGSSAMAAFVDAITEAYGQYGVRNDVWQRVYALLLYLVGLVLVIIGLPLLAVGPGYLPRFFPDEWSREIAGLVQTFYYPVLALVLAIALTTLYKLALPRKLPWHRGFPGACLAMGLVLLSSIGLRIYIGVITRTGYSYGALAAPIAFLLFTFCIGLAVVSGAHLNAAIQQLWPARQHRHAQWQQLDEDEHVSPDDPDDLPPHQDKRTDHDDVPSPPDPLAERQPGSPRDHEGRENLDDPRPPVVGPPSEAPPGTVPVAPESPDQPETQTDSGDEPDGSIHSSSPPGGIRS